MLTIIFLFAGALLVLGAIVLTLRSGTLGGRHDRSSEAAAQAQLQENARTDRARAVGRDD
jgi:hypothetical protein